MYLIYTKSQYESKCGFKKLRQETKKLHIFNACNLCGTGQSKVDTGWFLKNNNCGLRVGVAMCPCA